MHQSAYKGTSRARRVGACVTTLRQSTYYRRHLHDSCYAPDPLEVGANRDREMDGRYRLAYTGNSPIEESDGFRAVQNSTIGTQEVCEKEIL